MFHFSTRRSARLLLVPALALTLGSTAIHAAEPDDVVAKVGDAEITEADLAYAAQDIGADLQKFPPTQWRSILLDVVVDMELFAQAAEKDGLGDSDDVKRQLNFLKLKVLRNAYLKDKIDASISPDDLKAAYDKEYADFSGEEISARHILVKDKAEAEEIIKQLEDGADFAELAKEKSTGPSGPKGGELGYFSKGQMVPEFETAAFALGKGSITKEPVQTQFGWHVIKVEDKRPLEKPKFEDVAAQLRQQLIRERYETVMAELKADTPVEILDPTLAEQPEAK
ncbi:peptidylprolyl isomerase [uncultured Roseibium sp.]|uniref:peptidylprolyl isomerase n=1 Tax=uncultured Roseibium sp. TaxID=1936171 RepID=UPI003217AE02